MPGPLSVIVMRKRVAWLAGERRVAVRRDLQLDDDVRQDPGFLAGVERVVDGFLDAGEERLARVVEPEKVAVLGEELGDGDLALAGAHLDGGHGLGRGFGAAAFGGDGGGCGCHVASLEAESGAGAKFSDVGGRYDQGHARLNPSQRGVR